MAHAANVNRITKAEMEIMQIIWRTDELVTSNDILEKQVNSWKISTILTLASRLMKKEMIASIKKGRTHYYYPLMTQEIYIKKQTLAFLNEYYQGDVVRLLEGIYNCDINKEEFQRIETWCQGIRASNPMTK